MNIRGKYWGFAVQRSMPQFGLAPASTAPDVGCNERHLSTLQTLHVSIDPKTAIHLFETNVRCEDRDIDSMLF